MKIIAPIAMTDAQLSASNVTENDYAAWDVATTYDTGDSVISTTTHRIYESVIDSNLGNDPTTDDGSNWLNVSATNRWKGFDGVIADQVSKTGTITYEIVTASLATGIAFFGLEAASVQVEVYDTSDPVVKVFDQTVNLVDDSEIIDWFTFFTADLIQFQSEALFANIPAYPGCQINITIGDGTGTAKVGEIVLGKVVTLGTTQAGTNLGLRSFSTKEQDIFGNWQIVSRAKSDPITFQFVAANTDTGRIKRVLNALRDTPAVYFADESLTSLGATTYGFFQDYDLPLVAAGVTFITLEIEGLT